MYGDNKSKNTSDTYTGAQNFRGYSKVRLTNKNVENPGFITKIERIQESPVARRVTRHKQPEEDTRKKTKMNPQNSAREPE